MPDTFFWALSLNTVQITLPAQEELLAHDYRRSIDRVIEPVDGKHLQLVAAPDDHGRAVAAGEVDAIAGAHGRRIDVLQVRYALAIAEHLAGPDVEAGQDRIVGLGEIEQVPRQERRGNVRREVLQARRSAGYTRSSDIGKLVRLGQRFFQLFDLTLQFGDLRSRYADSLRA